MAGFGYYCALLLLEVKKEIGATSYPDIALKCFGPRVKVMTDIVLSCCQFGLCSAYVYFIIENVYVIIVNAQTWETDESR